MGKVFYYEFLFLFLCICWLKEKCNILSKVEWSFRKEYNGTNCASLVGRDRVWFDPLHWWSDQHAISGHKITYQHWHPFNPSSPLFILYSYSLEFFRALLLLLFDVKIFLSSENRAKQKNRIEQSKGQWPFIGKDTKNQAPPSKIW